MLLRIMNHLPSGTDFPERFQISVLYRISRMVSIGILHKFNPSILNSTAVIPDVSGTFWHPASSHECTFWHLARSLTATCCFARVHIKSGSPCPQYMFCRHSILIIYVIFSGRLPGSYLSFEAPATSPLSARSARTFGMTISPLKKSAKDHTSSSFRQEPITMQTTTIRE